MNWTWLTATVKAILYTGVGSLFVGRGLDKFSQMMYELQQARESRKNTNN